jgi:hypothetical protein
MDQYPIWQQHNALQPWTYEESQLDAIGLVQTGRCTGGRTAPMNQTQLVCRGASMKTSH